MLPNKGMIIFLASFLLSSQITNLIAETEYPYIEFNFKGYTFKFFDSHKESRTLSLVAKEITENFYTQRKIEFNQEDIMIDIGAHVGMISILYAKLYPWITIYAYEPIPENFALLLKNLSLNNITNVKAFNLAVTGDGRPIKMALHHDNTGASTQCYFNAKAGNEFFENIPSITLDAIFTKNNIKLCKLLKIDCEGSEYEILFNTSKITLIKHIIGEFHFNNYLISKGYSSSALQAYLIKNGITVDIYTTKMREL